MRNNACTWIICLLSLLAVSCSKSNPYKSRQVIIAGRVLNYNPRVHDNTMNIIYYDIMEEHAINALVSIDSGGTFRFECKRSFPQEFYLSYGIMFPLHASPGDSIFLKINPEILQHAKDSILEGNVYDYISANQLNNDFFNYFKKYRKEIVKWDIELEDTIKSIDAITYVKLVNEETKVFQNYFHEFENDYRPSTAFRAWMKSSLEYTRLFKLMRYWWIKADSKMINQRDYLMQMPSGYFDFLTETSFSLKRNKMDVFSWGFLHEYYMYVLATIKKPTGKKDTLFFENAKRQIFLYAHGELRQALLARYYSELLEARNLQKFRELYEKRTLNEPYYIEALDQEYRMVDSISKYPVIPPGAYLKVAGNLAAASFLDSLLQTHKNKVIYLDFWATWCSPCLGEIPASLKLQKAYKDQPVAFINLANQSEKSLWKATIGQQKFTGEHYLLSRDQSNVLAGLFGITALPHFALIDRKGKIVDKNAPRASNEKEIRQKLDKLLAE